MPAPLYFGVPPIPASALYVHHPTLLAEMMYIDRAVLGESERSARCLPILFSILTATLLCFFVASTFGWRGAALVLASFVAAPMELHYGQMVNFEAPELFFLLGALFFFHLWSSRRTLGSAAVLLVFCALAMWMDWQGYLLVLLLFAQLLIRACDRKMAVALLLTACVSGVAFLLQILSNPAAWQELFDAFRQSGADTETCLEALYHRSMAANPGWLSEHTFSPGCMDFGGGRGNARFVRTAAFLPPEPRLFSMPPSYCSPLTPSMSVHCGISLISMISPAFISSGLSPYSADICSIG